MLMVHLLCQPLAATIRKSSLWSIPYCTVRMYLSIFGIPSSSNQLTVKCNNKQPMFVCVSMNTGNNSYFLGFLEKNSANQIQIDCLIEHYLVQEVKQLANIICNGWCVGIPAFQMLFVYFAYTFHAFVDTFVIGICTCFWPCTRLYLKHTWINLNKL